jgi:methionyl aminopeptidase
MIVRTEEERTLLREGGARHAYILEELEKITVPGVTTFALESAARKLILEGGDEAAFLGYTPRGAKRPYPSALCVSINDAIVHGIPNEENVTLKEGDVVTLDLGLVHKGLFTDAAVTVMVGTANPEHVRMIACAWEALYAGIAAARAGNFVGDISAAIEAVGIKAGFATPPELGGHGLGRAVHGDPFIPNVGEGGTGARLVEGMVLAIEPMYTTGLPYIKLDKDGYTYRMRDKGIACHVEHTIIVGKDKAEILTLRPGTRVHNG